MAVLYSRAGTARRSEFTSSVPDREASAVECPFEAARGGVSDAMRRHFAETPYEGPRLVVDLSWVEAAYRRLRDGLGDAEIYYAMKANPHPRILERLRDLGASFDVASRGEIERCLSLGIRPDQMSFGNTIKRERDIVFAYEKGVRLFAFDSEEELEKLARSAPGASVFCRLLVEKSDADWPLSRKFGCAPAMAEELLLRAESRGLKPVGLSFHVGSQMRDPEGWRGVLSEAALAWKRLSLRGLRLELLNIGGGFPARYIDGAASMRDYADRVRRMALEVFGEAPTRIIAEPGRGLVADAGAIESEILLVSRKSEEDPRRWVYLDVGKFGGLAEAEGEMIRYNVLTEREGEPTGPCVLAGPTCDSADVLYERAPLQLPFGLKAGDRVVLPATGAYTTTYASVWFNGIEPLREAVIEGDGFSEESSRS